MSCLVYIGINKKDLKIGSHLERILFECQNVTAIFIWFTAFLINLNKRNMNFLHYFVILLPGRKDCII